MSRMVSVVFASSGKLARTAAIDVSTLAGWRMDLPNAPHRVWRFDGAQAMRTLGSTSNPV